jgi:hypothetical protein
MNRPQRFVTALAVMVAVLGGGCGGGGSDEAPADDVVVDEMEGVEDGQFVAYKLDPGTYKVELTASGDGAIVKWVGSSCPGSEATKTYTVTCEMTQTGQLIIENPSASGEGATATVTVKVTRVAG